MGDDTAPAPAKIPARVARMFDGFDGSAGVRDGGGETCGDGVCGDDVFCAFRGV